MNAPDVQYQIFDGRFRLDPDRAICLYVADDLEDAKDSLDGFGDAVIVAVHNGGDYEIVEIGGGK